jgi:DNA mismatch endonuclease (patch repair protein)
MVDKISKEHRSWNMSRVKSKNTKPELMIRSILHKQGYRFRVHRKDLPGNPDIVLPRYKTVIFVHGCFWHQHEGCPDSKRPSTNIEFWNSKLNENIARDQKNKIKLRELGWEVFVIWECEMKDIENLKKKLIRCLI